MNKDKQNTLTIVLFVIYALALIWVILFKLQFSFAEISKVREINLIPFKRTGFINISVVFNEIIFNVLIFIPLGIYMCILKSKWSFRRKIFLIFGVSAAFEILQFIFAIGVTDITDLIGNTLGGLIGICIYAVLYKILKNTAVKVVNIAALCLIVCGLTFISLLLTGTLRFVI